MPFVERYLSKIGTDTHDAMKLILVEFLRKRYQAAYEPWFAVELAAAVANYLFCDQTQADPTEARFFAIPYEELITSEAKELSKEDALCRALTCAVYNFCYGKYVDSGRKVGLLFHPFLGFVRAVQEVRSGKEPVSFLDSLYPKVGYENVKPLLNLWLLGLYRTLPYLPDSKLMLDEVVLFGKSVGSSVVK